jgi:hypothetical protein
VIGNSDRRDLAIFTIVQDEPEFIHSWINHYKKHVPDAGDIYVLVHPPTSPEGTPIPLTEMPAWRLAETLLAEHHGVVVVPVHHAAAFDHRWLSQIVSRFQSFLLQSYRWVLFAEIDEFVFPTPGNGRDTLLHYVRELDASAAVPAVRASGFEVVQQGDEPALSPEKYSTGGNCSLTAGDLVGARHWWRPSDRFSKTVLAQTALRWAPGFHKVEGAGSEVSEGEPAKDLTLVHLHKVDFDLALARVRRSRARKWSKVDIEQRNGWQNRLESAAELRTFWELDVDTGQRANPDRLSPIAEEIKQALR